MIVSEGDEKLIMSAKKKVILCIDGYIGSIT